MSHHVVSWKVYLGVFLALVALTVITVWVAGHDFGEFNLVVALGVAITKATLVVLYFMHARYSERVTRKTTRATRARRADGSRHTAT